MKYAAELGSGAAMYVPSFIKIGSAVQKLMGAWGIHRQLGGRMCLLQFFFKMLERVSAENRLTNQPPLDSSIETIQVTAN
jgi:hypothetical protein